MLNECRSLLGFFISDVSLRKYLDNLISLWICERKSVDPENRNARKFIMPITCLKKRRIIGVLFLILNSSRTPFLMLYSLNNRIYTEIWHVDENASFPTRSIADLIHILPSVSFLIHSYSANIIHERYPYCMDLAFSAKLDPFPWLLSAEPGGPLWKSATPLLSKR